MTSPCDARHLTPEDERKIAAYDAARSVVKIEGNTRAFYVLRAEWLYEALEAALAEQPFGDKRNNWVEDHNRWAQGMAMARRVLREARGE